MTLNRALTLAASLLLFACNKQAPAPATTTTPVTAAAAAVAPPATAPAAAQAEPVEAAGEEVLDADPYAGSAEGVMEVDPNATDTVTPGTLSADEQAEIELPGERLHTLSWRDRHGLNAVVITRQMQPNNGALLTATRLIREGDGSWSAAATLKELVSRCEFDLTSTAKVADGAVTDLDKDGLGEATFAWSAGCRSDVSPVTHKVLLITGDKKYVLRGQTRVETYGGEYKADPAFQQAPASFLAHAKAVWEATVTETFE